MRFSSVKRCTLVTGACIIEYNRINSVREAEMYRLTEMCHSSDALRKR